MRKLLRSAVALAAIAVSVPASAVTIYGLTRAEQGNRLVTFDSSTPGFFVSDVEINFGGDSISSLYGLDSKPGTNQLYSIARVANAGNDRYSLYSISFNGMAAKVGDITFANNAPVNFGVENVAFDFNPVNGRLRVVTSGDGNFVLDITPNAQGNVVATQANDVFYNDGNAQGDPRITDDNNPNVFGAAYTNNFMGAASTMLYVLDGNGNQQGDILSVQRINPNDGLLTYVGQLRELNPNFPGPGQDEYIPVKLSNNTGFDIFGADFALFTNGDNGDNECSNAGFPNAPADPGGAGPSGLSCIQDGPGMDVLFSLQLSTGVATRIGFLDRDLTAITAGPFNAIPEPATWAMMIGGFGLVGATARRRRRNLAAC